MQVFNASPREAFTQQQIVDLLLAENLEVDCGCELLGLDLNLVEDISEDFEGGTVSWDIDNTKHRRCDILLARELAWGSVLVRLYMTLSDGHITARFNVGVFCLTTPETELIDGEDSPIYRVTGFDRVYLLDRQVGTTYTSPLDETYYDELLAAFDAAGLSGVLIDGAAADYTLPQNREWLLVGRSTDPDQTASPVTWLRIINDLLGAINFRGVWADENGLFRCQRYQSPAERASEFTFHATDPLQSTVGAQRSLVQDVWKTPNRWVFRWSNRPGGMSAVEGDGVYTVDLDDEHPLSAVNRELVWTQVIDYEAASQAVLEGLGDRRVASDLRVVARYGLMLSPFPVLGQADRVTYVDAALAAAVEGQVVAWELDLLGGDARLTLEAIT